MITGFIGTTELLLIGGLALLLVGGKKLPEMMRGLGKGVREFKDGMKEADSEIQQRDGTEPGQSADDTENGTEPRGNESENLKQKDIP